MKKRILVIGGTGTLGNPTAHCLNEAGFQVRIMTRDIQKARKLFDGSFEIFPGDPMDTNCLEEAIHGCSGIHISLTGEAELEVAEAVARLAPRQDMERITHISGATVAEDKRWFPMIDRKFLAEKAIRESSVPYTIFCPSWVMEGLPMFVQQGRAAILGKQRDPSHWVAAEDIGRMVATAYKLEAAANKRFLVLGPEAILMKDALRRYCAIFHPEIKAISSMPLWLIRLLATLTHDRGLKDAGELMAYFDKVGEALSDGINPAFDNSILAGPATTFNEWLQKRKRMQRL